MSFGRGAGLRGLLLGGSALCGIAAASVAGQAGAANILPTQGSTNLATATNSGSLAAKTLVGGVVTPGTIGYTSTGPSATVALTAPRTLIDWTTFEVGAGDTLNFTFSSSSGIVLNRVTSGSVTVDAGGAVNGTYKGATGGNVWFLAPNGVFIHGTVTASGVLATNNASLANLNLLSDNVTTLKSELAAASSLIDLQGAATASNAEIDAAGDIILSGTLNAGSTGAVALISTGTITEIKGGAIDAQILTGSSVGGTTLNQFNDFNSLGAFTNTAGVGIDIRDAGAAGLGVTGVVQPGANNTLSLTSNAGPLTVSSPITVTGGALNLESGGALAIDAPINVNGATAVTLLYDAGTSTNLRFAAGAALTYNTAAGGAASASQGGSLTVNGQTYALLYKLAEVGSTGPDTGLDDIAGIDNNTAADGDSGGYALAVNVNGAGTTFIHPLVGAGFDGILEGLGHTVTHLTLSDATDADVAMIGAAGFDSVIRDIGLVGGAVTGTQAYLGDLVGYNKGAIIQAYAGGAISAPAGSPDAGGLVGFNLGSITASFATGTVGGDFSNLGGVLGGLAGGNNGSISQSYAAGAVRGGASADIGGLVGDNGAAGKIDQVLATGGVTASQPSVGFVGGLVGLNASTTLGTGAFDTQTTGQSVAVGSNESTTSSGFVGLTTSQLQTGGLPSGFASSAWGGGTGGVYPYLTSFYPNGAQAISGVAYSDQGVTPLPSTASGAVTVGLGTAGITVGEATTGANGYYYVSAPAGTFTAGEALTAAILSGGPVGSMESTAFTASGAGSQGGINIYGGPNIILPTQGSTNLAVATTSGSLAAETLSGGVVTPGTIIYSSTGPTASVTLTAPRTLIDWTTFEVGAGATLNFVFSSASGIVLNRLTGGAISVDSGGTVNGVDNGAGGGDIWFLGGQGVFIHGTVVAGGVLASNNLGLADLNLLSDNLTTLKGELSAGGGLIDLAGAVKVTGASMDAAGDIVLSGDVDTGASGTVNLAADGTITQTGGLITATTLTGSSVGGAKIDNAAFDTLAGFTNTGVGAVAITDVNADSAGMTVSAPVDAGTGNTLTLTTTAGTLTLGAAVGAAGGTVNLISSGSIVQSAGAVTTSVLTLNSHDDSTLGRPNLFDTLGASQAGGNLSVTDAKTSGLAVNGGGEGVSASTNLTLTTTAGPLTLSDAVSSSAMVTLASAGALIETAKGAVETSSLVASSVGGATLNGAGNSFDNLVGLTNAGVGEVTVTDANALGNGLTVSGAVNAGAGNTLTLTNATGAKGAGVLALAANLSAAGGTISLVSAGAITQSGGVITAGALTGSSVGGTSLTGANELAAIDGFETGGGNLSLTDGVSLSVAGAINAGMGTVSLNVSGAIFQEPASVITAATLDSASKGAATLTGPNRVGALGAFTNGGSGTLAFTDAIASGLTISSAITAGAGDIELTTTATGGALTLAANLTTDSAHTVNLMSAGPLSQSAGVITTGTLEGSSLAGVELDGANQFDKLGPFSATGAFNANGPPSGSGVVYVTDAKASGMTVTGAISSLTDVQLTTTNGGSMTLDANISGGAAYGVGLFSAGSITQAGGVISGLGFTGASVGGAQLNQANTFANIHDFANSGVGDVSLTAASPYLTVFGSVDADAGGASGNSLILNHTGAGELQLAGNLSAAGASIDLVSAGPITQTAGVITAGSLTGSSVDGTSLTDANLFGALAAFTNAGEGAVSFTDAQPSGLTVTGAVNAGAGNTLTLTTTAGPLTLAANLTAAMGTVDLESAGPIQQTAGVITTGTLTGASVDGVDLNGANVFDNLGPFTNQDLSDPSFTDAKATGMTVTGAIDAGAGDTLNLTTTTGPLVLAANLTAGSGTVNLNSATTISQTAGVIVAGTLNSASNGAATLTGLNQVANLGAFTNGGAGTLTFTDAATSGLTIGAPITAGAGDIDLTTTAAGAALTLAANLTTDTAHAIDIASAGPITQIAGALSTGALTAAGDGSVTLTGQNQVKTLLALANGGSGTLAFTDAIASGLTIGSAITAGAGDIDLTTTAAGATLALGANLATDAAHAVDLTSAGTIGQTAGVIATGTLTGSSAGGASLTGANLFANLGPFANTGVGDVSLTDAQASGLKVSGAVNAGTGNSLTLTTGGSLTLAADLSAAGASIDLISAGSIAQTAGVITSATLTGSSVGGTSLTDANRFGALAAFANSGAGTVTITDALPAGLIVAGPISLGVGDTLTLTTTEGPMTFTGPLTLVDGALNITSAQALTVDAPITVDGATAVNLAYNTASPTNLSFAIGTGLTYNTASGGVATSSQGGSLTVNGQVYNLLYKLAQPGSTGPDTGADDIAGIDNNSAAGGDAGLYALAVNVSGTGTAASPQFTGALVGGPSTSFGGVFEGLGHTISNLTIVDTTSNAETGLFGFSPGTVRDVGLVGGAVTGGTGIVGSLVGQNDGTVVGAYSSTSVTGGVQAAIGGLVGMNDGQIVQAFATGSVSGGANSAIGGLVGENDGFVLQAYATGAASDAGFGAIGGLAGNNAGTITEAYATGAVNGGQGAFTGGLVGNDSGGSVASGAFDTLTTGQTAGVGTGGNGQSGVVAGLTTTQLQTGELPPGFSTTVWAGGTGGFYPYLAAFYPAGVQAISGVVFADQGVTPLPSTAGGAVTVGVLGAGVSLGAATAGANGYYYINVPTGALTAGEALAASTVSGAAAATTDYTASGAASQGGINIYGGPAFILPTQGATNLAMATTNGSLAAETLSGGAVTLGTLGFTSTGSTATVTLTAPRTIVDWTTFEVGAGATLDFDFAGAGGIVLNRLANGAISVDAGGTVNGVYNGASGGNVWFLGGQGVFIHGTVAAGGVLATNNVGLAGLNLLSDNLTTLKGELSAGGGLIDLAGAVNVTGATLDATGNIILAGDVDTGAAGTVTLAATGTISQSGGIITATSLTGSSEGGATLTGGNLFDTLAGFTNTGAGGVTITDAQVGGLTVTGVLNAGADSTLTLTTANGPLILAANLTAAGGTVVLESGGPTSQTAGVITAAILDSASSGAATLTGRNQVTTLGAFTNGGAGSLAFTDAIGSGLTVVSPINGGAGDIDLTTTAAGAALTLAANLTTDLARTVNLVSAGSISQTAGVITTGTLTGSSAGGANLSGSNQIGALGDFATSGGDLTLADVQNLVVVGSVDAGTGTVGLTSAGSLTEGSGGAITAAILTTASDGPTTLTGANHVATLGNVTTGGGDFTLADGQSLSLSGAIDAGAGTVGLVVSGSLAQDSASVITAGALRSTTRGAAMLTGLNQVKTLNGLANSGSGTLAFTDAAPTGLTITSSLAAGAGDIDITTTAPGAALVLTANLTTDAAHGVDLISSGAIRQTAGAITTGTLTGAAAGGATLTGANQFAELEGFANTGAGGLSITDALPAGLDVTSGVDAGTGNVLSLNAMTGALTLAANLSAAAGTVTLSSASTITQTGGIITTGTLNSASNGATILTGLNQVGSLGAFTNGGAGTLAFTDAASTGLTITTALAAGAGDIDLTTTSPGAALVLAAGLTTDAAHAVDLASAGPVTQTAGVITTGTLTGTSVGGASLTNDNSFDDLAGFANSGAGGVAITDANADGDGLTVTGSVSTGAGGALALTNAAPAGGTAGPLTLAASLSASGGTADLESAGVIVQTAGVITAGTLTGSAVGGVSLTGDNLFAALGALANIGGGDISITDAAALTVTAPLDAGDGALVLTTTAGPLTLEAGLSAATGSITLASAGAITQSAGVITTGTLTGSSVGGASLTDANLVRTLSGFTNADSGAIAFTNAQALAVTGAVDNSQVVGVAGTGRDIAIQITAGGLSGKGVFTAERDVAIQVAAGSLAFASATAGGDLVLRAPDGAIEVVGKLISGQTGGDDGSGAGAILAANSPMSLFGTADPAVTGGDTDILARTLAVFGSTTAGGDVRIAVTGLDTAPSTAAPAGPALALYGPVSAGRDVALDATGVGSAGGATGSILIKGSVRAGRDVAARSLAGSLTLTSASAGEDVVLVAGQGAVRLDGSVSAQATGGAAGPGIGQVLFGAVAAPLDGLFSLSGQSVFIAADTYSNGGYGAAAPAALSAGDAIGLAVSDPTGLSLTDVKPASGSWVMASSLLAPRVAVFASGGDIDVGAATVNAPVESLSLYTADRVSVTGRLAPSIDNTVALTIGSPAASAWTPADIEVVNDPGSTADQGSIGYTTVDASGAYSSAPQTFYSAALYARGGILFGSEAFIAANSAITDLTRLEQIDPNQPSPATAANTSRAVLLAVGDVSLSAGTLIVQQDTAGLQTPAGVGSYITRSLTLNGYGGYPPPAIDLFGAFAASGGLITGHAAADATQITLSGSAASSPYQSLYRFNGCVIGRGTCGGILSRLGGDLDPLNQTSPLLQGYPQGVGGPLDPTDPRGLNYPFGAAGGVAIYYAPPFPGLWLDGLLNAAPPDIEDPTITGAPNEEIWRKSEDDHR